jgi:hypothetical protein
MKLEKFVMDNKNTQKISDFFSGRDLFNRNQFSLMPNYFMCTGNCASEYKCQEFFYKYSQQSINKIVAEQFLLSHILVCIDVKHIT